MSYRRDHTGILAIHINGNCTKTQEHFRKPPIKVLLPCKVPLLASFRHQHTTVRQKTLRQRSCGKKKNSELRRRGWLTPPQCLIQPKRPCFVENKPTILRVTAEVGIDQCSTRFLSPSLPWQPVQVGASSCRLFDI